MEARGCCGVKSCGDGDEEGSRAVCAWRSGDGSVVHLVGVHDLGAGPWVQVQGPRRWCVPCWGAPSEVGGWRVPGAGA